MRKICVIDWQLSVTTWYTFFGIFDDTSLWILPKTHDPSLCDTPDDIGEWEKGKEIFLSCPPRIENLVMPLKLRCHEIGGLFIHLPPGTCHQALAKSMQVKTYNIWYDIPCMDCYDQISRADSCPLRGPNSSLETKMICFSIYWKPRCVFWQRMKWFFG